ncbi:MAG: hypothetical protein Kow0073_16610 [Immundisolibacter sp.]
MVLARFVLIFTGLSFAGYGVACFLYPVAVAGYFTGFGMAAPAALIEARAMYGGLQAGFGVFCLLAGFRRPWTVPALAAIAWVMGMLALARLAGLALHGMAGWHGQVVVYEAATTVLAMLALRRLRAVAA